MQIRVPSSWELPESAVTPEADYRKRRQFLKTLGKGVLGTALIPNLTWGATAGFPSKRNPKYTLPDLEPTDIELITSYNNFYEFSTDKGEVKKLANRGWKTEPWTVEVTGEVENPIRMDVNDLIRKVGGIEQRVYRLRCVEAWSMVVPWDGFPLRKVLELVQPKSTAAFVKFVSFVDAINAPGQRRRGSIKWPYVEGLTLAEAEHDLSFMGTGLYGKPMPNQNGAPIRLVVPWKYGFKSIKSIIRIELTKKQPINSWNQIAPREYGFFANVNPTVHHPRWSQASERIIGGGFFSSRQKTLMFNGYEKEVAPLYRGIDLRRHY